MEQSIIELREQRLQKLFADCQREVLSQIIGPFGLSMAMFEDRNGGNVTTLHNFERADDVLLQPSRIRRFTQTHAESTAWMSGLNMKSRPRTLQKPQAENVEDKRAERIARGKDEYTGRAVSTDGSIELGMAVSFAPSWTTWVPSANFTVIKGTSRSR